MRRFHLSSISLNGYKSYASRVPLNQRATVALSPGFQAVFGRRNQNSGCNLGKEVGGEMFEERFERGSTAAYESGVDLENPVEISTAVRTGSRTDNSHPE